MKLRHTPISLEPFPQWPTDVRRPVFLWTDNPAVREYKVWSCRLGGYRTVRVRTLSFN